MSSKLIIVCIILGMATLVTGSQSTDDMATLKLENARLKQKVVQLEKKVKALESALRTAKGIGKRVDMGGKNLVQISQRVPRKYYNIKNNQLLEKQKVQWIKDNLVGQKTSFYASVASVVVKKKNGEDVVEIYCVARSSRSTGKPSIGAAVFILESQQDKATELRKTQKLKVAGTIESVSIRSGFFSAVIKDATFTTSRR